jgi:hypothetical protein
MEKMIESFWQKYKGQSATIFGEGKSLDRYLKNPDRKNLSESFFDSVWFGINSSYRKFKEGHIDFKYIFTEDYDHLMQIKEEVPSSKILASEMLKGSGGSLMYHNYIPSVKYSPQNIREACPHLEVDKRFKAFSHLGPLFTLLHLLCYAGFSQVYLVGADYTKGLKNQENTEILKKFIEKTKDLHNIRILDLSSFL